MNAPQAEFPGYVLVVCRVCKARMHPEVGPQPRSVKCPDCYTAMRVPSRADALEKWERENARKTQPDPGTYTLSAAPEQPKTETVTGTAVCGHCGQSLNPLLERKPRTMLCPNCYEPVAVPGLSDAPLPPLPKTKRKKRPADETAAPEPARATPFDVMAEIRREEDDPPPRWTFFSRVFNFPWQAGALLRWVFLSVLLVGACLLWTFAATLYLAAEAAGDRGGIVAVGFVMLPTIWLTFWGASYAAACCLPTITETAAGKNRIDSWPDPNWREWMVELIYTVYQFAIVAAAAFTLGRMAGEASGYPWIVPVALCIVLYPVVLLSSLEADSPWVPLSLPILRSLFTVGWAWLTFYTLTAALWGGALALAVIGFASAPYATAMVGGPVLAALLLISSRLLGRLAWRAIVQELPDDEKAALVKKRRQRRRPEADTAVTSDTATMTTVAERKPKEPARRKPSPPPNTAPKPRRPAPNPPVERPRPAPPPSPLQDAGDDYWNIPFVAEGEHVAPRL